MFYERLNELCKENGTTITALSKKLGLSSGNVTNWKNGRNPKTENALKLAAYYNSSVDYLLGRSDNRVDESVLDKVAGIDNDLLEDCGNIYDAQQAQKNRDDNNIRFALWGGDADIVDDEMLDDVKDFAKLLAEKKKRKLGCKK